MCLLTLMAQLALVVAHSWEMPIEAAAIWNPCLPRFSQKYGRYYDSRKGSNSPTSGAARSFAVSHMPGIPADPSWSGVNWLQHISATSQSHLCPELYTATCWT